MFADPSPKAGDTDYVLLFKIVQMMNTAGSGNHPPQAHDTFNNLLFKLALLANEL